MESQSLEVANTIRDQLGHRTLFMLGAQHLGATHDSLSFKIRGSKRVSHIRITLDPSDTYTVTFMRIRAGKITEVSKHSDIYCDMLHELIERETGLYTSL